MATLLNFSQTSRLRRSKTRYPQARRAGQAETTRDAHTQRERHTKRKKETTQYNTNSILYYTNSILHYGIAEIEE